MLIYSVLMALLFVVEAYVPYKHGLVSYLLYAITPVKYLLCRYMVMYFDGRIRNGEKFKACRYVISILSYILLMDFAMNLLCTIPFPRRYETESYIFFYCISLLEFVLNALAIWFYSRAYDAYYASRAWFVINLCMTFIIIVIFFKSFGENLFNDVWLHFLNIFIIIREPLKIRIGLLRKTAG